MISTFASVKSLLLFFGIFDFAVCKTYLVETEDSYDVKTRNQTSGEEDDYATLVKLLHTSYYTHI